MTDATDLGPNARLALDTLLGRAPAGVPSWMIHVMEHEHIERLAGAEPGSYRRDPHRVYLAFQHAVGTCLLDQYIPDNPLSMGSHGFEGAAHGATTGAEKVVCDGIVIDSPEAVIEHLERFVFPALEAAARGFDEDLRVAELVAHERSLQETLGPNILKGPYGIVSFPALAYGAYGYVGYFEAYALYPEVMERHFALQADLAVLNNRAAARAYSEGGLPPIHRLDHDMTDSRGTLVRVESLDEIWFPHFARAIAPVAETDVRLLWHCDGNVMQMVPRLIECGVSGFQGFQYEAGVDYERVCRMKTREGEPLLIIGGVSVTRTLPRGTPADVKRELKWLVEKGPREGLFLACSSTICPGTPWENVRTLVDGLRYYREKGRG